MAHQDEFFRIPEGYAYGKQAELCETVPVLVIGLYRPNINYLYQSNLSLD